MQIRDLKEFLCDHPGRCGALLTLGDDMGDNDCTFLCKEPPEHEGPHCCTFPGMKPPEHHPVPPEGHTVTVSWNYDERPALIWDAHQYEEWGAKGFYSGWDPEPMPLDWDWRSFLRGWGETP